MSQLLIRSAATPTELHRAGSDPTSNDSRADGDVVGRIRISQILSALSHALDLTEGQPLGHTVRACLIGMRIGEAIGLDDEERTALYFALLLKDAGCSSNAARMSALFGTDDRLVKPRMKLVDWHDRLRLGIATARTAALGRSLTDRVRHFLGIARTEGMTRDIIQIRCERGADIARRLGFPVLTAEAIRSLDEHWNGKGFPQGLANETIPVLARVANLAQTVEVFHATEGVRGVVRMLRARRGTWFEPCLADIALTWERDEAWWREVAEADLAQAGTRVGAERYERWVDETTLDDIAQAFADIIDAKSPFTFRHSSNVAQYACGIARTMGLGRDEERRLLRAGLLHDIGKVGISNQILDKAGPLAPEERLEVERHPAFTWQILSRVEAFRPFAWTASVHHEKLDGTGYPWRLTGNDLDLPARILGVADMYEALTADRPYRAGLTPQVALDILFKDRGTRLCETTLEALQTYVRENAVPVEL